MRELTEKEAKFVREALGGVLDDNGIGEWAADMPNPYLVELRIPVSVGESKAIKAFNELFHAIGVLPENDMLPMGESRDYCAMFDDGTSFGAMFNFPMAKGFGESDEEYQFTIKAINVAEEEGAAAEDAEMIELVEGIRIGRIKSKSEDGYLVLKGEFYDAIEAGEKKVEYRDFTEYNINRTIGIKTVRFNRGYAKNAPQMQWKVDRIVLLDGEDECDPYNVPEDFRPEAIAVHLGERIG